MKVNTRSLLISITSSRKGYRLAASAHDPIITDNLSLWARLLSKPRRKCAFGLSLLIRKLTTLSISTVLLCCKDLNGIIQYLADAHEPWIFSGWKIFYVLIQNIIYLFCSVVRAWRSISLYKLWTPVSSALENPFLMHPHSADLIRLPMYQIWTL